MRHNPLVKTAPLSVLHTVAKHYIRDAHDFLERFNILWEAQLHKTGRIKSFVDLLLATECSLKGHIVLHRIADDPITVYKNVRSYGHKLDALAAAANYLEDRSSYRAVQKRLAPFSILIRYSLDAYETFFPSSLDRDDVHINYSKTIGNNPWVLECRDIVASMLDVPIPEFEGFVTDDLDALFQHEKDMQALVGKCM